MHVHNNILNLISNFISFCEGNIFIIENANWNGCFVLLKYIKRWCYLLLDCWNIYKRICRYFREVVIREEFYKPLFIEIQELFIAFKIAWPIEIQTIQQSQLILKIIDWEVIPKAQWF